MDLTLLSCCVAQCTTLLWCWSLTSVQVRLSPLQGSRVLCRRSSLRWPSGRVLKVQCSQSLVYSGVLALFEVLGTTPNSPPRRDNAVTSEKYNRVGYVPSPPGSPPWRQLSFRTEPCWEKPLTWCPCSSRKIKISYPVNACEYDDDELDTESVHCLDGRPPINSCFPRRFRTVD